MKKWVCFLLALLVLLSSACSTADGTTEQKKDISNTDKPIIVVDNEVFANSPNSVLKYAQHLYEGYDVQFQVLPKTSAERDSLISRLRIEIMTGGGPDAFILACDETYLDDGGRNTPLFQNIEKAMRLGIFMPLDDFIAKSEFLKTEDHHEIIMDAGKTEEGQLVLPLLYSMNVYLIEEQQNNTDLSSYTWNDVLKCEDKNVLTVLADKRYDWFGRQYTQVVDYDMEQISLSPDEIERDMKFFHGLDNFISPAGTETYFYEINQDTLRLWEHQQENMTLLTVPNDTGGLTATISAYAAINRNSEYAEEVFKYIELLFSEEVQSDRGFIVPNADSANGEIHYGANTQPTGYLFGAAGGGLATHKQAYSGEQGELVCALTEQVNSARFCSDIESELLNSVTDGYGATDYQELAKDAYDKLSVMLSE